MFIVSIKYIVGLEKIENFLNEHIDYLKLEYAQKNFILSGRKNPRTGGIILSNLKSKSDLEAVLARDPFKREELATYEITEMIPSMSSKELNFLLN